jgi:hypothetical protein
MVGGGPGWIDVPPVRSAVPILIVSAADTHKYLAAAAW